MTLRIVAGESESGRRCESVREPIGSPVSTYCSTISRRIAADRGSSPDSRPGCDTGGRVSIAMPPVCLIHPLRCPACRHYSRSYASLPTRDWK
ncbi:hypothetical protein RAA17_03700 [Komagataeibacter rhaeticus]|nr:hypothetical protein [Komagataeibacter rhaeticus]